MSLFVVAVLFLACVHEPFLLSRAQQYTFAPFAAQQKGKNKFRKHPRSACCPAPTLITSSLQPFRTSTSTSTRIHSPLRRLALVRTLQQLLLRPESTLALTTLCSRCSSA